MQYHRTTENGKLALKGLTHRLTHPRTECKSSRLKNTQTVFEGYTLVNLKTSAGEAETYWDALSGHKGTSGLHFLF